MALALLASDVATAAPMGRGAALATLPPSAGRVVAVEEQGAGRNLRQRIVLSGGSDGDNYIELRIGDRGPRPVDIPRELAERFPGVAMQPLKERTLRNGFGRMNLAIGAPASGGRCIYAWQDVNDVARAGGYRSSLFERATPASLRIRMCSATATLDQLGEMCAQVAIGGLERAFGPDGAPSPREPRRAYAMTPDMSAAYNQRPAAPPMSPVGEGWEDEAPRVMVAQVARRSGRGGLLERSSGNPGGLIGMLRGYRRTDPITTDGVFQGPRKRRAAPATRRARPAARRTRTEPETYTPPAAPVRQTQQPTVPPQDIPAGYREPGSGARYLGPTPGAVPVQPQPQSPGAAGPGPGPNTPVVPAPATSGPGAAQQPAPTGSAPITRGLDPSLPGRALRGPTGG